MNTQKFKAALVLSGYTQVSIAREIGMSKNTLNSKILGKSRFYVDEVIAINQILKLSKDDLLTIFFE